MKWKIIGTVCKIFKTSIFVCTYQPVPVCVSLIVYNFLMRLLFCITPTQSYRYKYILQITSYLLNWLLHKIQTYSALALNVISKYVNAYRCKVRAKLLAPLVTNATASELVMSADGSLFILIIISRTRIPSLSAIEPGTICK